MVILVLLLCTGLASCQRQAPPVKTVTARIDRADEEILRIAEEARNTLPGFFRQLGRADSSDGNFCVKYPFRADSGSGVIMEQVWLTGIHFKNGGYYGVLAGAPQHLNDMKKGDMVTFYADEISDWMYIRGGKIAGGRSIKYLLEQIPESRRSNEQRNILQMFE